MTSWRLATNTEYRTRSALFGIGRSTVAEVVVDTYAAIRRELMPNTSVCLVVTVYVRYWMVFFIAGDFPKLLLQLMAPKSLSQSHRTVLLTIIIGKVITITPC